MDLHRKLADLLGTDAVLTEPQHLAPYLTDHRSLYQGRAAAVVLPRETSQVAQLLAWCHAGRIPVVPQGATPVIAAAPRPMPPAAR